MTRKHLPQVLYIENNYIDPWNAEDFRILLSSDVNLYIAEINDEISGYIAYGLENHVATILNIAVHPDKLRNKIGSNIIYELIKESKIRNINRIRALVPEENLIAQLFLKKLGFEAVDIIKIVREDIEYINYKMVIRL